MRLAFAGTPQFAALALAALMRSAHPITLVFTQPDRPAGRGLLPQPSAVKQLALENALPLRQPANLRSADEQAALRDANADILVVAAYGLILPQAVLDIPALGAINIHASLLPRWRGAAPIQRALLAGDVRTGITIMRMDAGLDTGPILFAEETPITDTDTTQSLHDRLAEIGARLIVTALDRLEHEVVPPKDQPHQGMSYAAKISKADAGIDWSRSARQIDRQVRAFNPTPGARTRLRGVEIKIWQANPVPSGSGKKPGEILQADADSLVVACGSDALRIELLQKPGAKRLPAAQFLRGFPLTPGEIFAS